MISKKCVYVLGCGGHAKVVVQTLHALGYQVAGVFDDDARKWKSQLLGTIVDGPIDEILNRPRYPSVIAVGSNAVRSAVVARLDLEWLTVVHPRSVVDSTVSLGPGTVVFAGAVVQADTRIGSHAIINTSASVDHDCVLGDFVHIAPGTHLAGGVRIGNHTLMGLGSIVIPERSVGADSIVGAGAVVTCDLPDKVTAVGVPARVLKRRDE